MTARSDFKSKLVPTLSAENLVFVDECSSNAAMARQYGRGPSGQRVHDAAPVNYGENLTIIGALTLRGLEAVMTIPGATTGAVFLTFVKEVLCPVLRRGQVVIVDNLAAHKVAGIRKAIEDVGATLLYLPSYSPDLNPIEPAWSKLKNGLRSLRARTEDALIAAVGSVMRTLTAEDCRGWFRYCGYDPST